MILVKERVYFRTRLKVSHVRFREDRWDSSYRIYKDIDNKYTEKLLKAR